MSRLLKPAARLINSAPRPNLTAFLQKLGQQAAILSILAGQATAGGPPAKVIEALRSNLIAIAPEAARIAQEQWQGNNGIPVPDDVRQMIEQLQQIAAASPNATPAELIQAAKIVTELTEIRARFEDTGILRAPEPSAEMLEIGRLYADYQRDEMEQITVDPARLSQLQEVAKRHGIELIDRTPGQIQGPIIITIPEIHDNADIVYPLLAFAQEALQAIGPSAYNFYEGGDQKAHYSGTAMTIADARGFAMRQRGTANYYAELAHPDANTNGVENMLLLNISKIYENSAANLERRRSFCMQNNILPTRYGQLFECLVAANIAREGRSWDDHIARRNHFWALNAQQALLDAESDSPKDIALLGGGIDHFLPGGEKNERHFSKIAPLYGVRVYEASVLSSLADKPIPSKELVKLGIQ